MKKGYTDITFLLDRSGSMAGTKKETLTGYNEFLKEQKDVDGKATFTLVQFATNSMIEPTKNIQEVELLTNKTYSPTGSSTAYLDALGRAINETGRRLRSLSESERPEKVIVVVITDGFENSSKEFTKATINDMIKHQEQTYNWQFVFLGANFDAVTEGKALGMSVARAFTYTQNDEGLKNAYGALSANMSSFRVGTVENMNFKEEQREKKSTSKSK